MFFNIKSLFFFFIFFLKINFSVYEIEEIGLNKFSKGQFENYLFKVYNGKIKFYLDSNYDKKNLSFIFFAKNIRNIHQVQFSWKSLILRNSDPHKDNIYFVKVKKDSQRIMEYMILNRNKIELEKNLDELIDRNEIRKFLLKIYEENQENSINYSDYLKELIELLDSKKYTNIFELDFLKKIEETKNNIKFFVFDKDCTFFENNISLNERNILQEFYDKNISLNLKKAYKISILYALDYEKEDFNIIGQCKFSLDEKNNIGQIDSFFVNDFWIGYGFGKEFLYQNLNYFFHKYKINEISLLSFDESENFYKNFGFQIDQSKSKILNFLSIKKEDFENKKIANIN